MNEDLEFSTVLPEDSVRFAEILDFLRACGLEPEEGLEVFVACHVDGRLAACAGLEGGTVKCVAIHTSMRGMSLSLPLMNEVTNLALERGHGHLFLYTKPENLPLFEGCGFHKLVEVPGQACLLENTPVGLKSYCDRLRAQAKPGARIGGIVLNANPFTLGHQYLVSQAAQRCDALHLFVVAEDASMFSTRDRFELVQAGTAGIPGVTLHPGSRYMISRGTFPSYFIKDRCVVEACGTAVDLLMFREHLAPALGITHRFVGSEPFCALTRKYNADMHAWLEGDRSPFPAIEVVELPRIETAGRAISASEVRRRLRMGDFEAIAGMVPPTTLAFLQDKYAPGCELCPQP